LQSQFEYLPKLNNVLIQVHLTQQNALNTPLGLNVRNVGYLLTDLLCGRQVL